MSALTTNRYFQGRRKMGINIPVQELPAHQCGYLLRCMSLDLAHTDAASRDPDRI